MAKEQGGAPKTFGEYGIDPRTFVVTWETSDTIDEVYERLAAVSAKLNLPAMPKPIIAARAAAYRTDHGVPLKKMKRVTRRSVPANDLIDLVARIRSGEAVEAPPPAATPAPAVPESARAAPDVQKILKKIRGS